MTWELTYKKGHNDLNIQLCICRQCTSSIQCTARTSTEKLEFLSDVFDKQALYNFPLNQVASIFIRKSQIRLLSFPQFFTEDKFCAHSLNGHALSLSLFSLYYFVSLSLFWSGHFSMHSWSRPKNAREILFEKSLTNSPGCMHAASPPVKNKVLNFFEQKIREVFYLLRKSRFHLDIFTKYTTIKKYPGPCAQVEFILKW